LVTVILGARAPGALRCSVSRRSSSHSCRRRLPARQRLDSSPHTGSRPVLGDA